MTICVRDDSSQLNFNVITYVVNLDSNLNRHVRLVGFGIFKRHTSNKQASLEQIILSRRESAFHHKSARNLVDSETKQNIYNMCTKSVILRCRSSHVYSLSTCEWTARTVRLCENFVASNVGGCAIANVSRNRILSGDKLKILNLK